MGLKVGTVKLEEYNQSGRILLRGRKNLKEMFGDVALAIEHIGSTSEVCQLNLLLMCDRR